MILSLGILSRRICYVVAIACVLSSAMVANAAPLGVGQTLYPAPGEPDPTGGQVVCPSITFPYATATFSGTLTSAVLAGDPSNPYAGTGGLTFVYMLHNNASSINVNARFTVRDWTGFSTDASFQIPASGVQPTNIDRITADVVGFSYLNPPIGFGPIAPGANSALMVVQTNATTCVPAIANVIDGAVATVNTYGPAPEPSTLALLGLAGLALARRRR